MFVYQKTMLDRYYCIKSFFSLDQLKNASKNSFLYYYINGAQKHEGFVGFENACSKTKTCVILTSLNYVHFMHITDDDVNFCVSLA